MPSVSNLGAANVTNKRVQNKIMCKENAILNLFDIEAKPIDAEGTGGSEGRGRVPKSPPKLGGVAAGRGSVSPGDIGTHAGITHSSVASRHLP